MITSILNAYSVLGTLLHCGVCVCVYQFNPHKNRINFLVILLSLILFLSVYYAIIIYRLSDDVEKNSKKEINSEHQKL